MLNARKPLHTAEEYSAVAVCVYETWQLTRGATTGSCGYTVPGIRQRTQGFLDAKATPWNNELL